MAAKKESALKTALGGDVDKLSDKQKTSALNEAVSRIGKVTKLAETSKEQVMNTGTALMHSAEMMGSLFLGSMAEGFFGPDKLRLGGVDVRAPSGLVMQGYGLYQILSGQSGGQHVLSLGNGVTGSWLGSVGQEAGRALRERRGGEPGTTAPAPALPAGSAGPAGPALRGEEPLVQVPGLEGLYGPSWAGAPFGGPGLHGPAQPGAPFGGPGLLPAPAAPGGFLQGGWAAGGQFGAPAPGAGYAPAVGVGFAPAAGAGHAPGYGTGFAPSHGAGYAAGYGVGNAPGYGAEPGAQLNGPVREILPAEEGITAGAYPPPPGTGYGPVGYGQPPVAGAPLGYAPAGMPVGAGAGQFPRPVMQFTPEAGDEAQVQGPRPRMRFTPEARMQRPAPPSPEAFEEEGMEGARPARRARARARTGEPTAPPLRPPRPFARAAGENRFPRARRAEDLEAE